MKCQGTYFHLHFFSPLLLAFAIKTTMKASRGFIGEQTLEYQFNSQFH